MKKFITTISIVLTLCTYALAQQKVTLYYDESFKGIDESKKAPYYRIVNLDEKGNIVGKVETFFKSGKIRSKGNAIYIDKLNDINTIWVGNREIFNEAGVKINDDNFDSLGRAHGIIRQYSQKGELIAEGEYASGNPIKDYYLVYEKGNPIKYSYLTLSPMNLKTSDKVIAPISERKLIYKNGVAIQYYTLDGISVALQLARENQYGDYFAAYITIENGTDKPFNFDPTEILAVVGRGSEMVWSDVISYNDYIKKVNRRQAWSSAFNTFAESQAANSAGYSANVTGVAAVNNSGGAAIGASVSQGYSGANAYAARQQASANIGSYNNTLYNIKKNISDGYLKTNTVFPDTRLIGFVYMRYQKADGILINIPVNGTFYQFGT